MPANSRSLPRVGDLVTLDARFIKQYLRNHVAFRSDTAYTVGAVAGSGRGCNVPHPLDAAPHMGVVYLEGGNLLICADAVLPIEVPSCGHICRPSLPCVCLENILCERGLRSGARLLTLYNSIQRRHPRNVTSGGGFNPPDNCSTCRAWMQEFPPDPEARGRSVRISATVEPRVTETDAIFLDDIF